MGNSTATRPLRFDPDLPGLTIVAVVGTESVSQVANYEVVAEITDATAVDFSNLPGQLLKIVWKPTDEPDHPRHFRGVVAKVADADSEAGSPARIALYVRPWLWLLTLNVQCRIYQSIGLNAVIDDLIGNLKTKTGQTFEYDVSKLSSSRPKRNYCVQYNESDFDFLSRLLEDEGVYYYFNDAGALHFAEMSGAAAAASGRPSRPMINPASGPIRSWKREQTLQSGSFVVRDYNFQAPERTFVSSQTLPPTIAVNGLAVTLPTETKLIRAEAPAAFAKCVDAIPSSSTEIPATGKDPVTTLQTMVTGRSALRGEELASGSYRIVGSGSFSQFFAGCSFRPNDPSTNLPSEYFVVSVKHEIQASSTRSGSDMTFTYKNRFECMPTTLTYRPPRKTPKPRIHGTQTARVVGPASAEVHTDIRGRILVEFLWSESDPTKSALGPEFHSSSGSAWVRVAQPSAGKNWGTQSIPRVGQEVVVGFENGDPDMPIVLGCVYNTSQTPAFPVPQFRLSSGMKTHTPGDDASAFSGIRFDDTAGKELAQVRSNRDMLIDAKDTIVMGAANRFHRYVGKGDVQVVGGGLWPFIGPHYQPKREFPGVFPPQWEPLAINEGNMFTTNSISANFGDNTIMDVMYRLNATSSRHDVSCACVSPLTLLAVLSTKLLGALSPAFKGLFRSGSQGVGRLDFNVGPAAEITCGSSLLIHRGGHYELSLGTSWSELPAVGQLLKLGWYLYALATGIIPSMMVGADPNKADDISKVCAFLGRGMGFILLNIEHLVACLAATKTVAKTALNLGEEADAEIQGEHMNCLWTVLNAIVKAKEAVATFSQDLDVGNQFVQATGSYYLTAGDDVGISAKTGLSLESHSVVMLSDAISMKAAGTEFWIGNSITPFKMTSGLFELSFEASPTGGGRFKCGPGVIDIDLLGNITISGLSITMKTAGAAIKLGPATLESSAPIAKRKSLLKSVNSAPAIAREA